LYKRLDTKIHDTYATQVHYYIKNKIYITFEKYIIYKKYNNLFGDGIMKKYNFICIDKTKKQKKKDIFQKTNYILFYKYIMKKDGIYKYRLYYYTVYYKYYI